MSLSKSDLAQFTGTENHYRHGLNRTVLYTDGVKFFAERAGGGAYWFLDILATELNDIRKTEGFLSIKLDVKGTLSANVHTAQVIVDDGNGNVLHTKDIAFTDCPVGEWKFYMADAGGGLSVIMLPSEY